MTAPISSTLLLATLDTLSLATHLT